MVTPQWDRGHPLGMAALYPLVSPTITYLWLQRLHPPHPKASAGRCPGQCCPFPGSPQRWPPGVGAHRSQAWWRLSPGTKRTPGREAGQRLSAVASPCRSSAGAGGGHGGVRGAQTQDAFVFLPAGARGQRGSRTPAPPRGYSWIRPMAPSTARQERLQGGEDMNQSGVPSPAGGSWPVRQLPITQPGSVYSRSTTPYRLPCQAGEGNVLLGWGWHSRCALFGDSPPPRAPGAAVALGLL